MIGIPAVTAEDVQPCAVCVDRWVIYDEAIGWWRHTDTGNETDTRWCWQDRRPGWAERMPTDTAAVAAEYVSRCRENVSASHDAMAAVVLCGDAEVTYEVCDVIADMGYRFGDDDARWDWAVRIADRARCTMLAEVTGERLAVQHLRDLPYSATTAPPMFLYPDEWYGNGTLGVAS